jgi:CBS domain-containing protein
MSIDLSSYRSIQTNLFVRLVIPGYSTLTFSDYHRNYTISGTNYTGLGQLLAVGNTEDSLRAAPSELSISISGIPSTNVTDIINNRIKGSECQVFRGFFDVNTGELLSIAGNPAGKFQGVVSNYDIADDLDMGSDTGTVTLTLTVTSVVELLQNKINGRRTNTQDFPNGDMARVLPLQKSNFNFGAPQ